ncbi:hypothetical protein [Microvirga sp. TS319]|uniref:hypothetical protein n=1 Tax=Microvirga sp. TS319 TaxID=3241165 RepID=UPI00351A9B04
MFDTPLGRDNVDVMTDFTPGTDWIRPSRTVFGDIGKNGILSADNFWSGTKARAEGDRIIFNKSAGTPYYDPDGDGPQQQIKFATVGEIDLSAAAFLII